MKTVVPGLFLVAVAALGVGACSSPAPGSVAGDSGTVAPHCYASGTDPGGGYKPFTIAVLGTSDCTEIADAADVSVGGFGYTVAPNTSKGPGSVICEGMVTTYVVSVIASGSDPALCNYLGLSAS
jgi:hypothetical protein